MKTNLIIPALTVAALIAGAGQVRAQNEITNASFDIARELFAAVNKTFVPYWKEKTGQDVTINQSHAGSSKQASSILEGLQADVVTFNQVNDVLTLVKGGFVEENWQEQFADHASPYIGLHGILVRKGNPKGIKDWSDLAKKGVEIVQVNPKTGGNGRYAVLAYYTHGLDANNGDADKARAFLKEVLGNVVVFDQGGRAASTTFTERGIGDALVTFESETIAYAAANPDKFEFITPSTSVQSDFPIAVVKKVADARKTTELAKGYLEYLYTREAQEVIAENFYRPRNAEVLEKFKDKLPPVKLFQIEETLGPWTEVNAKFFESDGLVDQVLAEIGRGL